MLRLAKALLLALFAGLPTSCMAETPRTCELVMVYPVDAESSSWRYGDRLSPSERQVCEQVLGHPGEACE